MRPILLSSCAQATTAEELSYRIDRPIQPRRGARVVALDDVAAQVVDRTSRMDWNHARFYARASAVPEATAEDPAGGIVVSAFDGAVRPLADELVDADVVVLVAADEGTGSMADAIGRACIHRGIMMAGIILGDTHIVHGVAGALRPNAHVLLVTSDEQDLSEVLTALRA